MTNIHQWAIRHGVSHEALRELTAIMTEVPTDPKLVSPGTSEAAISNMVRVEASDKGCRLFRNQVGACEDARGRQIRYGLCNDSKQMNKLLKSSDLVGIRQLLITPDHVGSIIGQFMAREVKHANWSYKGDDHETAQLRFLSMVHALGGDACFVNGIGTI